MCITVGDVGGFSLSDPHLLLFFYHHDVVGSWVRWFTFPGSQGARRWCTWLLIGGPRLYCQGGWLCLLVVTSHSRPLACHTRSRARLMNDHRFAFSYGISCRVQCLSSFIQFLRHLPLLRSSSAFPCPLCSRSSNTLVEEMAHDSDHGKHPHNEDSSRGLPPPPSPRMLTVLDDHWLNAARR
jgi:hypothetical protein